MKKNRDRQYIIAATCREKAANQKIISTSTPENGGNQVVSKKQRQDLYGIGGNKPQVQVKSIFVTNKEHFQNSGKSKGKTDRLCNGGF